MLKFEGKFKVGQYVRAYDFKPICGREESYIEGTIVGEEHGQCSFYKVRVDKNVFDGKENNNRVDYHMYVAMEISNDYDHRIFEL